MYASPFDCVNAVLEYHPEIVFLIKNTGKIRENFNKFVELGIFLDKSGFSFHFCAI